MTVLARPERSASGSADQIAMWARHARARELVRSVSEALGPVQIMPLKGVILGALGIVDTANRPISDVDILLRGISLAAATRRLRRVGFRIMDVPIAHGYLSLSPPTGDELSVDLHATVMPTGLGRLTASYMFDAATERGDLFDATIYVPSLLKLTVHTIANIIKDRVVHALPHNALDLAALLRQPGAPSSHELVRAVTALSLARASALALTWACSLTHDEASQHLLEQLVPEPERRRALEQQLAHLGRSDKGGLAARIAARGGADARMLHLIAPLAAAADFVTWPVRNGWLRLRG